MDKLGRAKKLGKVEDKVQSVASTNLWFEIEPQQCPIVYRKEYNVHFGGFEKLHPFDASKWGNIFEHLKSEGAIDSNSVTKPEEATEQDLLVVHSKQYLKNLKWSWTVAKIAEIPPLALLPNYLVQRLYLRPMRFQTGGSILAGRLAMKRGWAINIGGGFHHANAHRGGGFCVYADITLLIQFLFNDRNSNVKSAMIVDLDAHQGNGYQRDFINNQKVYIMDVYNKRIYPRDTDAKKSINCKVELEPFTSDETYLDLVEKNLDDSLDTFQPDILVYNAGTDILEGDRLGCLSVSPKGILRRDLLVFQKASERGIPIVMLTSGGYLKVTAKIIANSILNLHKAGLITLPFESDCIMDLAEVLRNR
ncbi:histone deacetylase 11 isoform X2 [Nilaparvata lugens]|uniref:histone deacetylase 11 isoform X1 n=1 Tax=Nilaparvata lugens TaxID=108931 RepID=UPI00193C8EC2|nr:histone deacetylase 11 isoform X1 [Nilaparvata lugens]XP_039295038.1 histone deacetylase 11 isoform X1 [Nilaparvata lugens]XP_039295039.1 histone deacetylase 11 isoform X1 [Nilaparvata lugens]XP_039295040.1 histone deacetylase 11 isoform X2 [Nilaparvata lugens]XP_039295041.1 histone deacetylase 11 isoform X2 [Nilaparvata lugens]